MRAAAGVDRHGDEARTEPLAPAGRADSSGSEPQYDDLESRLVAAPDIAVPAITLQCDASPSAGRDMRHPRRAQPEEGYFST